MRLVTWNCKGAFHRKHAFAAALRPDILIVPECEKPSGVQQPLDSPAIRSFEWFGSKPAKGLAVISYGDYVLEVHPSYDPRHQWIVPLSVSGPVAFVLFAVWTLPLGNHGGRYVRPLFEAFESYKQLMNESEVVWAGDFNSTFYLHHHADKGYHIDYVFTSDRFHPHGVDVWIGSHSDWSARSDHAPLVCDLLSRQR